MDDVESTLRKKCHAIIHSSATVAACIGAGMAQLPLADNVPIMGIQIGMGISLGAVYSIELTKSRAESMVYAAGVDFQSE